MKRNISLILILVFTIGAVSIIIMNNRGGKNNELSHITVDEAEIVPDKNSGKKANNQYNNSKKPPNPQSQNSQVENSSFPYAFATKKIICPLKIEPMLYVILQIRLAYSDKALKSELIYKKEDLEAVIQNILFQCERQDLKAPVLREKLLLGINGFLETGSIEDIIFKDFKIEIKKK